MEKIMQFKNNAYLWNGGRRDAVDREFNSARVSCIYLYMYIQTYMYM